jgi:hypothetical protein
MTTRPPESRKCCDHPWNPPRQDCSVFSRHRHLLGRPMTGSFQHGLPRNHVSKNPGQDQVAVAGYIDRYNRIRRHSSYEMNSPVEFEAILTARTVDRPPRRKRREYGPPGSPQTAATRSSGTRHRADGRLNQQSATLHNSGGSPGKPSCGGRARPRCIRGSPGGRPDLSVCCCAVR